jgi:hypothetical protein
MIRQGGVEKKQQNGKRATQKVGRIGTHVAPDIVASELEERH